MRFSRLSRVTVALIVLLSMLFTQLAVASYACPTLDSRTAQEPMEVAMDMGAESMTPCHEMDKKQPNLCQASEQADKQSLDKPHSPPVALFLPIRPFATLYLASLPNASSSQWQSPLSLARSTSPPLSIQNCCFRI